MVMLISNAIQHQVSVLGFASKLALPINSSHSLFNPTQNFCFSFSKKIYHPLRLSSGELPTEADEEAKFVPLNPEDPSYGPPVVLLLGFKLEEADRIQQLLKDLDGEFLKVIYCTEDMITRSLWDAVNTEPQALEKLKIAESIPRICFLSGLTGDEMIMFIDAFEETGLEDAVFAAVVPNSASKPLQELIEEIMGDHEMVTKKQSDSTPV